jgi:hypothetical protein
VINRTKLVLVLFSSSLFGQSIPSEELNLGASLDFSTANVLVGGQTRLQFIISICIAEISDLISDTLGAGKSNKLPVRVSERFQVEGTPNDDIY